MSKVIKTAIPKLSSPRKAPFTVFIEGNIGAGKTTFLNHFKKYDDVRLYTEPVEKWRNVEGVNLLVKIWIFQWYSMETCISCVNFFISRQIVWRRSK